MVHPLDVGITRSLIGFCVLLQMCVLPLRAQDSELPVDAGRIVHARPWRTPDRRVQVDFIVQFDELRVFPGMVLSAWRATRAGELEALPEVRVGLLRVLSSSPEGAIARAFPFSMLEATHVAVPVILAGDFVRVEEGLEAIAAPAVRIPLEQLFPEGDASLGKQAGTRLSAALKTLGSDRSRLLVAVISEPTAAEDEGPAVELDQARVLARKVAALLKIDESRVSAVTLPASESDEGPRAAVWVLPAAAEGAQPNQAGPH